jgi:hypothetical protein
MRSLFLAKTDSFAFYPIRVAFIPSSPDRIL